jgi:hypothetical protein
MKTLVIGLFFLSMTVIALADYTYVIDSYQDTPSLYGNESLLMIENGGGGDSFDMWDNSLALIQGTSTLGQGTGGIWHVGLFENSTIIISGGEVHEIAIHNNATARLTGGLIQQIWSSQYTTFGPHITIVYSGTLPTVQKISGYDFLVGNWGNGDPFSIYLSEVPADNYGYDPAITNIRFELIPEPATVFLLSLGGLFIRRKK